MAESLRIASVGTEFSDPRVANLRFGSSDTWIDREVLLLRLDGIDWEYESRYAQSTYQGARNLSDDESARIKGDFGRRRVEVLELIKLGRTVVLFLSPPSHWYVDSGQREYSGTGRNQKTTRLVERMEAYSLFPFKLNAAPASTRDLEFTFGEPFAAFWRRMRGRFQAAARLTAPSFGTPFLTIRGTDSVVASFERFESGGLVIVLPQDLLYEALNRDDDEDKDEREDVDDADDDDDEADWPASVLEPEQREFVDALLELTRALRSDSGDFELPSWAEGYKSAQEREQHSVVVGAEAAAQKALTALSDAKSRGQELARRKILITGTGPAFEIVVHEVFEALGFSVTEGEPGRTDRIVAYDGFPPCVVEAKGVAKSAAEAYAAQLEKWVSEFVIARGEQPKAVLVVNGWRDLPLNERRETFPDQMLPYATSRGHCLITGAQLLGAWYAVEKDPRQRDKIVAALHETIGRFPLFSQWQEFLEAEPAAHDAASVD